MIGGVDIPNPSWRLALWGESWPAMAKGKISSRIRSLLTTISTLRERRGSKYFWYLLTGCALPAFRYRLENLIPSRKLRAAGAFLGMAALAAVTLWVWSRWGNLAALPLLLVGLVLLFTLRAIVGSSPWISPMRWVKNLPPLPAPAEFPSGTWSSLPVEETVRRAINAARAERGGAPLVIGKIDSDGRVLGSYGPLPGLVNIIASEFQPRARVGLDLVLWGDRLLVRKDYRGDFKAFAQEWAALSRLAGRLPIPALFHVDEAKTQLFKDWISGPTLRDLLVEGGAKILHQDSATDPALAQVTGRSRIEAVWARGRESIHRCVRPETLSALEAHLEKAHHLGAIGVSWTYGNVVIDPASAKPYLIDLDRVRITETLQNPSFQKARDREREQFNLLYGTALLTERSVRTTLSTLSRKLGGWYSPIDFGQGLTVGSFWSTDSGTGRWEYLNGTALKPLIQGARVLDLGCNTAVMSILMLRDGAREVLAVELSPDNADAAEELRSIFEWRDQRSYALKIHRGNMLDVLENDWGRFDIVTAFCSLYYLEPAEMAAVIRKAASLAPVLILQAKTDTRRDAAEQKSEKSSLEFLKSIMEQNGFPRIEIKTHPGFTRPLLIGTT